MIHVVVVAHGNLGRELILSAEMIVGSQENVYTVGLFPEESPEGFGAKLDETLSPLAGQDTLILIDLFGGTPYNVAARKVLAPNIECVTGANLPMLLEVLTTREYATLEELANTATTAGEGSVKNLGPLLRK